MDSSVYLLIGLILGLLIGVLLGVMLHKRRVTGGADDPALIRARHEAELASLRAEGFQERSDLQSELAHASATVDAQRERVEGLQQQLREQLELRRSDEVAQKRRAEDESRVLQALSPVQEALRTMQGQVTELEKQRSVQHGELSQQLLQATASEERLRSTAESLASALRSNDVRGVWGETQLRNVVEAAGLLERVDFDVQASIQSDAGTGRPDMVVRLPGGKSIAVDAKVPFSAYLEASHISVGANGEDADRRRELILKHVKAVRGHIDALASRSYWQGLAASPELVIAFIPSESLISSALEADPALLDYAFSKRVALASPVTLWSVLKTVAYSWQQDVLTEDAKHLFDLGKELYQRLSTLSEHADKLRRSIEATVRSYNQFASSLESRVLVTARKLQALDESKVLGTVEGIDTSPQQLTAAELMPAEPMDGRDPVHTRELVPAEEPVHSA
ncbi:DNA recombination protein RmuC [Homoserinimonas sp. OAct 916]|uniref:DNA recombination protein RmuC n=1 Tax=Homoserinimonas sp. OAct 916 TaxID=2211450 RepID=UPI000DBE565C|nr:DNA recombination protein RmuC [Homoserinimonas sp. OAct 916]